MNEQIIDRMLNRQIDGFGNRQMDRFIDSWKIGKDKDRWTYRQMIDT